MQNQSIPPLSGAGPAATPPDPGPVQGGGFNAPSVSDKNFVFRHKRFVGAIILLGLLLTAVIIVASSVFFKKPQNAEQEAVESAPFDVNTINKDSELPQTGGE